MKRTREEFLIDLSVGLLLLVLAGTLFWLCGACSGGLCQVKQTRCNGQLVEVCAGGRWHRFADCSQVLRLDDGRKVEGQCIIRPSGRAGCQRID